MPLPATFPNAPQRPPVTEAFGSKAWLDYFAALDRFNAALRAHLATL